MPKSPGNSAFLELRFPTTCANMANRHHGNASWSRISFGRYRRRCPTRPPTACCATTAIGSPVAQTCPPTGSAGYAASGASCAPKTSSSSSTPGVPPNPGVASKGGFAYRPRTAADGNLMIRVNDWTTMTDEARRIWSMDTIPAAP